MQQLAELFGFALGVTGPTFLWVLGGVFLSRFGRLPQGFIASASLLVFRAGIPLILFFAAVRVDYSLIFAANYLLAGIVATFAVVLSASLYARWRGFAVEPTAIFVQGAFRANLGIVGIALCAAAYGVDGLALAALPVAVMTILYNLIAVVLLNRAYGKSRSLLFLLRSIVGNPLIIGISLGVLIALTPWQPPPLVFRVGGIVTAGVLPLSLLLIGASLSLRTLHGSGLLTLEAVAWRLLLAPLLAMLIAVAMGVHGAELGVLFLLQGAPVAAASYIMVMAVGGDGALAARLVVVSTLFSSVTLTLGLAALQISGLV